MQYDFGILLTNREMARKLGVDPRTLRSWAKKGFIPSHVNPANKYRYFDYREVINALRVAGFAADAIDDTKATT